MSIIDLSKSAVAEPVTALDVFQVCRNTIVGAACLGYGLGQVASANGPDVTSELNDPLADYEIFDAVVFDDNGRVSAVDSEAFQALLDAAVDSVKQWAGDMKRFYNKDLLTDMVLDMHVRAFDAGAATCSLIEDALLPLAQEFRHTI